MAHETPITIKGNATADPELRFTPNGVEVVNFTIASTPRHFDRQANEFKDGDTIFIRITAWRELAENIAETVRKGMRVIVTGNLTPNNWEKDGVKHSTFEITADDVGPSLLRATAAVTKTTTVERAPHTVDQQTQAGQRTGWGEQPAHPTPQDDPWATGTLPEQPPF